MPDVLSEQIGFWELDSAGARLWIDRCMNIAAS
jgi:hypothetical protein